MWFNFQTKKTVTRTYEDRLVLKGKELELLREVVARSAYANPAAGLPESADKRLLADFAASVLGLPLAVDQQPLPTDAVLMDEYGEDVPF